MVDSIASQPSLPSTGSLRPSTAGSGTLRGSIGLYFSPACHGSSIGLHCSHGKPLRLSVPLRFPVGRSFYGLRQRTNPCNTCVALLFLEILIGIPTEILLVRHKRILSTSQANAQVSHKRIVGRFKDVTDESLSTAQTNAGHSANECFSLLGATLEQCFKHRTPFLVSCCDITRIVVMAGNISNVLSLYVVACFFQHNRQHQNNSLLVQLGLFGLLPSLNVGTHKEKPDDSKRSTPQSRTVHC